MATVHAVRAPERPEGFYWIKLHGEILPAKYIAYSNDLIEEKFYDSHPDLSPYDSVIDYGWILDFSEDGRVFDDEELEAIGEPIVEPRGGFH